MTRWRWPLALLVVVLVLGSGGYAVAQARDSGPAYRTATATLADVDSTLQLSGTVTAAGRRDLSFGAAGTVAKVLVKAGQRVKSGRVLARLETTSFDADVTKAVATLAKAKAQLVSDEDAQADAVTATATAAAAKKKATKAASKAAQSQSQTQTGTQTGTTTPATGTSSGVTTLLASLASEQKSVESAQSDASTAIAAAKDALTAQTQACQSDSDAGSTPTASASASPASGGGTGDSSVSAACTTALNSVQAAQDTVSQKQDTLQAALTDLGKTLSQTVTAVGTSGQSGTTGTSGTGTTGTGTTGTQSQGGTKGGTKGGSAPSTSQSSASSSSSTSSSTGSSAQGGSGGTVTAARLAQDQADIDTAQAQLNEAETNRDSATMRAPYAGRILTSDIAKGDLVASSDPAFVLVGKGATTVTTTVTNAQVPSVRRGQQVVVTPAGWTTSLTGTVSAIGLLPDSSSVFPVTVTVSSNKTVSEGTTASVAVVTGSAKGAVTVPLSALTKTGNRATVQVLKGGTVTRTVVTAGVVGTRRVAITQGLQQGATVVIADLDAAVPSSTTTSTTRGFGAAGGGNFQRPGQ